MAGRGLAGIAEATGVSKMTVSRVLRGAAGFSDATRQRVLQEAERQGYVPNRLAAAFGSQTSELVGLCVPTLGAPLLARAVEALAATLDRFGYQTVVGTHEGAADVEERWLRSLAAWRPAAVVVAGSVRSEAALALLAQMSCPVLEFWSGPAEPVDFAVSLDHAGDGARTARCFLEARRRRIGFVGTVGPAAGPQAQRLEGFRAALGDAAVAPVLQLLPDRSGFYPGLYGTEMLLARRPDLDAIFYADDEMAIGGIAYLERSGRRIPGDVAVAGWGGAEARAILRQRLTTHAVPSARIGRLGGEALLARLSGREVEARRIVNAEFVRGDTV